MMVRLVQRWEIIYGHFADWAKNFEACNAIARDRGWAELTIWAPLSGKANEIVVMGEWPDYAAFKAEVDASYVDAEYMKLVRAGSPHVVQGSGSFELLEPLPPPA
jgi:hypothetical protein